MKISWKKCKTGAWVAPLVCATVLGACGDVVGTPIRGKFMIAKDGAIETDSLVPSGLADAADAIDAEPPKDAAGKIDSAQPETVQVDAAQPHVAKPDSGVTTESADCATVTQWPTERTNAEQSLLDAIFEIRNVPAFVCEGSGIVDWAWIGLPLLRFSPELRCSARLHSVDMAQRGFYSLTDPDGIGPPERMRAAGFGTAWLWAEWIHRGSDPDEAFEYLTKLDNWACTYLTDSRLTAIGVGYYEGYWTLDLAFAAQ
jgi:uncharacterized protein YkwD